MRNFVSVRALPEMADVVGLTGKEAGTVPPAGLDRLTPANTPTPRSSH